MVRGEDEQSIESEFSFLLFKDLLYITVKSVMYANPVMLPSEGWIFE